MRTFLKYILCLVVVCFTSTINAQTTTYPIQLHAVILPPYTNCLGDYVSPGNNRMRLTAIVKDMTRYGKDLKIAVSLKVKMGNTVLLETQSPRPQILNNVGVQTAVETADLFDPTNSFVRGKYAKNGWCLPEGAYEFEFQLFDYYNTKLPLSLPVSMFCYLNQAEPPVGLRPITASDDDCLPSTNPNITFSWMDAVAVGLSQKKYTLSVYEVPDYTMVANMFGKQDVAGLVQVVNAQNLTTSTYTVMPTTTFPIEGKSYMWRVSITPDYVAANPDSKSNYTAYKNNGHSQWYAFSYGCKQPEPSKVDLSVKPEIVSFSAVEGDKSAGKVTWKLNDKFCGYILKYQNKEDKEEEWASIDVTNDRVDNEDGTSSYVVKNLAQGETFLAAVVGIVECGENQVLSGESDQKELALEALVVASKNEDDDCKINIDHVQNSDIKELKIGDCFYANGNWVRIETVSYTNGKFTGSGVYSFSFLKNVVGVNVKFTDVKINESRELIEGDVIAVSDKSDNMMININDWTNKSNTGKVDAPQQKDIPTVEMTEEQLDAELAKSSSEFEGKLIQVGDKVYTIEKKDGKLQKVELGTVQDQKTFCPPMVSGVDNENGYVKFSAINKWEPPFDYECNPFCNNVNIHEAYKHEDGYGVPWIAMAQGQTITIKAEFKNGLKSDDVAFYCYTANKTVKLTSTKVENGSCNVTIFAGDPGYALYIFAMKQTNKNSEGDDADCSGTKTFGRAQIFTCAKKEHKIKMVPVFENIAIETDKVQKELNSLYGPLGQTFVVDADGVFNDESIQKYNNNKAFELDETDAFKNESQAMKDLRRAYKKVKGDATNGYDAFIFVLPKRVASNQNVGGEMPRSNSVGYVFTSGSSYGDYRTLSHEIGHGLYSLEHTFSIFKDVAQGSTDNLMDYSSGQNLKYWQWTLVNDPKGYVLPFFDDADDAQGPNPLAECALKGVGTGVANYAVDKAFDYYTSGSTSLKEYWDNNVNGFEEAINITTELGSGVFDKCKEQVSKLQKLETLKDIVVPIKDLALCIQKGSSPATRCFCEAGADYIGTFMIAPVVKKVYDKFPSLDDPQPAIWAAAMFFEGFGISEDMSNDMAKTIVKGIINGKTSSEVMEDIINNVATDVLKKFCKDLTPIDIRANAYIGDKKDDKVWVWYSLSSNNISDFSLNKCIVNGVECEYGGDATVLTDLTDKTNVVYKISDNTSLGQRAWAFIRMMDQQGEFGNASMPANRKEYAVLVDCSKGKSKVEFVPNPSYESDTEKKKEAIAQLTRVTFPCMEIEVPDPDCCVLTDEERARFGLSKDAYLDKTNMVVIDPICPNLKRKYTCTNCDIKVNDCTVDFGPAVKKKFNLPSNAELKDGKVKFTTDCCEFEFPAVVECCEVKKVDIKVPDYTTVDDAKQIYYKNKLLSINDNHIEWKDTLINCKYIFIKGVKHKYEEYFTKELIKNFYVRVLYYLMYNSNLAAAASGKSLENNLKAFCNVKSGNKSYLSIWNDAVQGKEANDFYSKEQVSYGNKINWDELYEKIIADLKSYVGCRTDVRFECLLGEVVRSMSRHLLEFPEGDNFISDGSISYVEFVYDKDGKLLKETPISFNLNGKVRLVENSLSEFLVKMFYLMHGRGELTYFNTTTSSVANFLTRLGDGSNFTSTPDKTLSLSYNLIHSYDCCK